MWSYVSLEPSQHYGTHFCNLMFDNFLYEARLLFWQAAQLQLYGFTYWGLNAWRNNLTHAPINGSALRSPFVDPAAWSPMQPTGPVDPGRSASRRVTSSPLRA